ncbi:PXA domain-domain-containing protein [Syncephalastrum racemosum]|uniref:PXA domain-domain-containing protein n=1 Tax=Syncephalastrum racemosum TaxID=13706 RepID=A0A1X2H0H5_SYNRA|nr:PXA domain-domain-containing protein [Syncephalastrum racemosum]
MSTDTTDSLRLFHLRVLFPDLLALPKTDPRRIQAPPPITRSQPIDAELYTYIALLVRDFIHPWYRVVTTDQEFTAELVSLLTHIIQSLEDRMCNHVDWTALILIHAPHLLHLHYSDYRQAKRRLGMGHASNATLESLFHGMQPHVAIGQEQEYLRALTNNILRILLKQEDYQNDAVRHLVRELLANLVLANLTESLSDPYTIHMIIVKLLDAYTPTVEHLEATGVFHEYPKTMQKKPTVPITSALAEAQNTELHPNQTPEPAQDAAPASSTSPSSSDLPSQLQRLQEKRRQEGDEIVDAGRGELDSKHERRRFSFGYITLQVILAPLRALMLHIMAAFTHSQERYQQVAQYTKRTRHTRLLEPTVKFLKVALAVDDRPVLQWAYAMLALFLWPLIRMIGGGLLVDKFLEQTILHILSEDHLVFYLQLGRNLLWPDGAFLRKSEAPTELECEHMRIRAERLLTVAIPAPVLHRLYETDDLNQLQMHIHDAVEPLQNKYINKHLMFLLVDLVASRLLPELLESGETEMTPSP